MIPTPTIVYGKRQAATGGRDQSISIRQPGGGDTVSVVDGEKHGSRTGHPSGTQEVAHNEVEALNTEQLTWTKLPGLIQGRHGTGAVLVNDKIVVASGCGNRGGTPELNTMEVFIPKDTESSPFSVESN